MASRRTAAAASLDAGATLPTVHALPSSSGGLFDLPPITIPSAALLPARSRALREAEDKALPARDPSLYQAMSEAETREWHLRGIERAARLQATVAFDSMLYRAVQKARDRGEWE